MMLTLGVGRNYKHRFRRFSCVAFYSPASIHPKALRLNFYYELFLMFPHYKNLRHNHVRAKGGREMERPTKSSIKQINVSSRSKEEEKV